MCYGFMMSFIMVIASSGMKTAIIISDRFYDDAKPFTRYVYYTLNAHLFLCLMPSNFKQYSLLFSCLSLNANGKWLRRKIFISVTGTCLVLVELADQIVCAHRISFRLLSSYFSFASATKSHNNYTLYAWVLSPTPIYWLPNKCI